MSAASLIVAVLCLLVGLYFLFQHLQRRQPAEWQGAVGGTLNVPGAAKNRTAAFSEDDDDAGEEEAYDGEEGGAGAGALGRRRGRGAGGLRRRGAPRHAGGGAHEEGDDDQHNEDHGEEDDMYDEHGVKLTRLQRKKLQKEREREERRQQQEAALDAQRARSDASDLRDAEAALREEERKAAEEAALEELRAEKKRADDAEYAKWVSHIGVEERGELGDEAKERQARVQAFLVERAAKVQARAQRAAASAAAATASASPSAASKNGEEEEEEVHVLVLQSAARDLKVSVEELVNTIEQLTRDGKVDGVFDDRGKYVFIAPEQFPQLAQFIRLRGRVSVQEFTRECNRIVMQA